MTIQHCCKTSGIPASSSGMASAAPSPVPALQQKTPPRRQAGFTLLELMIAMALTAMLLGMLSAGVYTVVNEWEDETSVLDRSLDRSLVLLQIERALHGAFPHSFIHPEDVNRKVWFLGEQDSLSWVSTVSPYRVKGLTAWQLQSDRRDGVSLRLAPAFSDDPSSRLEAATANAVLADYTARFSYLYQRQFEEKLWLDEWIGEEMQSLPLAVHIVLTPRERDDLGELEILAPIKAWRHEDIVPTPPDAGAMDSGLMNGAPEAGIRGIPPEGVFPPQGGTGGGAPPGGQNPFGGAPGGPPPGGGNAPFGAGQPQ